MNTFDARRNGFEKKFTHDQELKFKSESRRNKLLGDWAAGLLGLSGADKVAYARSIIKADMQEPGDLDVFRKLRKDFDEKGVPLSDQDIRRAIDEKFAEAVKQIQAGSD